MLESLRRSCNVVPVWLVRSSVRHAVWVVLGTFVLTGILLYYTATHLKLDTNTVNMLDPSLPFRKAEADFDRAFPQFVDLILIVIDADSADRAEDAADALSATLRDKHGLTPLYQPGDGPFFERNGLLYLGSDELSDLADQLATVQPFLASVVRDPSLRGLFTIFGRALEQKPGDATRTILTQAFNRIAGVIEDLLAGRPKTLSWQEVIQGSGPAPAEARRRFIVVQPSLNYRSLQPGKQALRTIRETVHELHLDVQRGVKVRVTGSVAMDEEELESVSKGATVATVLSFALVCLLLFVGLRARRLVVWILVTLFLGLAWTAAFATVTVGYLNLLSVTFAVLFIGLAVDFGIQFGLRYREELRAAASHTEALTRSAAGLCDALMLAGLSAAVSFFCFIPTAYRGLAQLGFIAGVSMFIALLATLVVFPALLTLWPISAKRARRAPGGLWQGRLPVANRRTVMVVTALIALGAAILVPRAHFDFNPLNLKDPHTESVATFHDLLSDPNTTPYTIDVLSPSLQAAEKLAARLDALPAVDKTITLDSFVPEDQDKKLDIINNINLFLFPVFTPSSRVAPPTATQQVTAVEQFRGKLEKFRETLPSGELSRATQRLAEALTRLEAAPGWPTETLGDLEQSLLGGLAKNVRRLERLLHPQRVTLADLPAPLKADYVAPDGRARIQVFPKRNMSDNRNLRAFVAAVQPLAPHATGVPVTLVGAGNVVVKASLQATVSAMVTVFLLLAVMLASIGEALLILLPLMLSMLLTVALTVVLDVPFNFANVIAIPLLLGVGVAFGIYLVVRKRKGLTIEQLFQSSTPRAVLFSGLTTMASFGTLAISEHRGMSSIGLLVTFALSFALLSALIVLPAILAEIDQRRGRLPQVHPEHLDEHLEPASHHSDQASGLPASEESERR